MTEKGKKHTICYFLYFNSINNEKKNDLFILKRFKYIDIKYPI